MQVTINGAVADIADAETVAALVAARDAGHDRVAVALNGDVVPRSSWATTQLAAGDRLEILAPTAGG
jgi:sulfur carrier protein